MPLHSLFFCSPNITQPCPQIFSVKGSIICSGLHFWRHFDVISSIICSGLHFWHHFDVNGWIICSGLHFCCHWFNMAKILCKFGEQQLVMVNYVCGFNQSETGKYFERIIIQNTSINWQCNHLIECAVPKNIFKYSPQRRDWNFQRMGYSLRPKIKEMYEKIPS